MIKYETRGQVLYLTANEFKMLKASEQGARDYRQGWNRPPTEYSDNEKEAWRAGWNQAAGDDRYY